MANRVRNVSKHIMLTEEENKVISEKAKEAEMTESAYMRLLISQRPNDYPEMRILLKDLINEVNHIGVNINQITKNHNAGFYSDADKNRLFAYMRKICEKTDEVVKEIGNH